MIRLHLVEEEGLSVNFFFFSKKPTNRLFNDFAKGLLREFAFCKGQGVCCVSDVIQMINCSSETNKEKKTGWLVG